MSVYHRATPVLMVRVFNDGGELHAWTRANGILPVHTPIRDGDCILYLFDFDDAIRIRKWLDANGEVFQVEPKMPARSRRWRSGQRIEQMQIPGEGED